MLAFTRPGLFAAPLLLASVLIPSPAQAQCIPIKESLPTVLKYHLPVSCSAKEREQHPLSAKEVTASVKSGKAIDIDNAVVEGPVILRSASAAEEISIKRTKVNGPVDWSYATFKGVVRLQGTTFERDADFRGAIIEKDIFLDDATFKGNGDFLDVKVSGVLYGRSLTFKKRAIFNRAVLEKSALFTGRTVFEGEADFGSARVGSSAEFTGAVFKQKASFNTAQIGGAAFFDPATFEGEADFGSARIGSTAGFARAVFKKRAIFNRTHIAETAFFNPATFEGEADFGSARVGSSAEFTGAVFKQKASFNTAQIGGAAFFDPATFEGEADFIGARIGGNALLTGAIFNKSLILYNAVVLGDIFFGFVVLRPKVNVDLRGSNYNRIYVSWALLRDRLQPSDAQVYKQLEEAFRRSGENTMASEVYYHSRYVEGSRIKFKEDGFRWLNDRRLRYLVGYGRAPFRLLWFSLLWVLIGLCIFRREGAVQPKDRGKCPLHPIVPCSLDQNHNLSRAAAFWVSLDAFLPGVEVKAATPWEPSPSSFLIEKRLFKITYAGCATILRLFGWIVLVLGFAALPDFLLR